MAYFKALNPPETVEVNKKTTFVSAVPAKVVFEYKNFLIQRLDDHPRTGNAASGRSL